ncbi:response regulator transcription factor [Endozoicomonas sp. SESOKO1]|uniref:response regulator transcription factor n=1 Tax=Endozoicomonas sp. SESOKO1 TaxID=2828742 RepID=UPI0021492BB8|nr:response regulator [Endozoicomonas sp. SESOKO1]
MKQQNKMNKTLEPTVFIIDDDEAVRDSLQMLMKSVGQAVETFFSPIEFLEVLAHNENPPGCIVTDIRMPGMNGFELQGKLNEMQCTLPVIFISGYSDVPMAVRAIKDGATNFIQKPFRDQELLDLIHDTLKIDARQRQELLKRKEILRKLSTLTERECEVLCHIISGKPNKVVAADINLSYRTVEIHRSCVMKKLGVKSLAQLVRQVMQVRDYLDGCINLNCPHPKNAQAK